MKFPKNPQIGQLFKPSANSTHKYQWVGYAWEIMKIRSDNSNSSYSKKIIGEVFSEVPTGQIDGTNSEFNINFFPVLGSERVYLNGLLQKRGEDYLINGKVITFLEPPTSTSQVVCTYSKVEKMEILNETPIGQMDNINCTFVLKYIPDNQTEQVYLNGLLQKNGGDYSINENFLVFSEAPMPTSIIICNYITTI